MHMTVILLAFLLLTPQIPYNSSVRLPHSLAMPEQGLTVRYPDGWSAMLEDDSAWIVNAPHELAKGEALDRLAQIFCHG
jgi:hypothetical protein